MEENSVLSPDVVCTDNGAKSVDHLSGDPLQLQQARMGRTKGFHWPCTE